jgi:predicted ArsR family transcriptional regulator
VKRLTRRRRLSQGTSGQIIELLRREALTIDQIASAIGLTRTAVRAQLAALQQHGDVEQRGTRRSPSKPARIFGVTAEAELLLSRAYVPILTQLLHVLTNSMPRQKFDTVMREVGRGLMTGRAMPTGTLRERVLAASALMNDLGGTTEIEEKKNHFLIRGHGCPLAAATAKYPEACNAIESLLREFLGHSVSKCCDLYERRRCCFEVAKRSAVSSAG